MLLCFLGTDVTGFWNTTEGMKTILPKKSLLFGALRKVVKSAVADMSIHNLPWVFSELRYDTRTPHDFST